MQFRMEYKILEKSDLDALKAKDNVYVFFKKTGEYKPYEFIDKEEANGNPYLIRLVTRDGVNEFPARINEENQLKVHFPVIRWTSLYIPIQNGGRRKNRRATKKARKNRYRSSRRK
jgi:hypothetical protein